MLTTTMMRRSPCSAPFLRSTTMVYSADKWQRCTASITRSCKLCKTWIGHQVHRWLAFRTAESSR